MHKVAAYKINIQKSTVFLYTSNVYYQEEKKEKRKEKHFSPSSCLEWGLVPGVGKKHPETLSTDTLT